MKIKEIVNFKIFESDKFSITAYQLLVAIIILLITWLLLALVKRLIKKRLLKKKLDIGNRHAIYQLIRYFTWTIAILLVFETIGLKITILLAGSAALLVGLGLGLQEIFKDIVSGITVLVEGTVKVGDVVELNGIVGKVIEIGLRASKIETRDNIIIIIPNTRFVNENVINWSHAEKKTRFEIRVGVAYGSDVNLVKNLLLECVKENKEVEIKPEPFVRFTDFGESSLDFSLFFWTNKTFEVENIRSDIRFKIEDVFRNKNIVIPFPQRDIHIKSKN